MSVGLHQVHAPTRIEHLPRHTCFTPARGILADGKFAGQMVALRFFDHVAPGGSVLDDRVAATGYAAASLGEDIGEGAGADASSAAAIVAMWMDSAPHRANILDPGFRDAGAGVVLGDAGLGGGGGAGTYVLGLAAPAGPQPPPA